MATIVEEVCTAIWDRVAEKHLKMARTPEEWKLIAANFEEQFMNLFILILAHMVEIVTVVYLVNLVSGKPYLIPIALIFPKMKYCEAPTGLVKCLMLFLEMRRSRCRFT